MKYPFVRQRDLKDCGCCSLLMLTRFYGGGVSLEYLRELTNTTKTGTTAYDLIEGSRKLGFNSIGVKGTINELNNDNTPCIAHVVINKSYEHFIVIYKVDKKKKKLLIADSNKNNLTKMTFEEFNRISTGNFILLKPKKKIMYVENNKEMKNFVHNKLAESFKDLTSIVLFSILITFIQIMLSFEFKVMLDYIISFQSLNNLISLFLILFSIILLKEISNLRRNKLVNKLNHNLDKSMFTKVYNHLLSLPYLYYKNRTTGEITSRIHDLTSIRDVISKCVVTCFIDLFLMLGALIALFFISSKLLIIVLIVLLLTLFSILILNKPIENAITNAKENGALVDEYLVESISGIETIRHQNLFDYAKKKFLLRYSKFNNTSYRYNNLFISLDFIKSLIVSIGNLIILVLGSYLVVKGNLDIASLITFITLNNYIFSPIDNFTELVLSLKDAKVSFNRVKELFEIEEEHDNINTNQSIKSSIITQNLTYSYNNRDNLLKNINLNINNGDKVLIYGKSGSGKSTLAKILAGDLKPNNNQVYFDDKDINRYSINSIRKNISYLSSNDTLFTDTVYNNIVLDKDNTLFDSTIKECLVDEFIDKQDLAYNFLIEENGFNLSGGQRQRITLARGLLNNSNIYIFDEALNQVDIEKERIILKNIFNKYPNKTFIYISHRFNNADLFNKKYKIEDGISYEEYI